jgi:uncharacterized protein YegP (UPF0339 family)
VAAKFELYLDAEDCFRFRLIGPDGTVMLTSEPYADEDVAIAGIWSVREAAARGKIVDITGSQISA